MRILLFIFLGLLISCGTFQFGGTRSFQLRPYQEESLPNGLKILFIEDQTLPVVHLSLLIKSGALQEEKGEEGLNFMTSQLLEQGTVKLSATQLADELGQIAAEYHIAPGLDSTYLSISVLSGEKNKMADLFADTVLNPSFQSTEIERMKSQQLSIIKKAQDNPSGFADLLLDRVVFEGHRFAVASYGTEKTVKTFNRTDIMKHYLKHYRPNNALLSVSGRIDEEYKQKIRQLFSGWQRREVAQSPTVALATDKIGELQLFTKSGLQQAQVRFSQIAIQRNHPDYLKLRVALMVLGGGFSSRLNQKIRDDLGLTYSIHSLLDAKRTLGTFEISTFTRNEKLAETIVETKKMLKEFADEGVRSEEIESVKALMAGQFPTAIETTPKLAQNLLMLRFNEVSDDYLKNFYQNLAKINRSEVNEAIKKYFKPEKFQIIVYADEAAVGEQMQKIGSVRTQHVELLK